MTPTHLVSAGGTRIAVETVGEGPPLVLTTGALQDRASVRLLAQTLADRATVHLWDRHGRGDSEGVPDPRRDPVGPDGDALVAAEVADLAAVTAAAGGVPLHYGHSAGAVLVLERCSGRGPSPWPRRSRTTSPSSPATRCRPTGSRAAAVPGARRRTLPGQGHLVTPAVLAPVLADFLTG
ncbi:MAG: alpha/beta hydrolase fold [Actinomycetospora sp.]|nr:alpha/beta hydrolase fold [Actinomycetospora sp.]